MRAAGLYPYYRTLTTAQEPRVRHEGRELVMLGSNNYLGLTSHPEVKAAAADALARYGTGCAGSRLLNGTLDIHVELEQRLAEFLGRSAVLIFSTGFQVNLGVLSCLLDRSDVAFLDKLDHASIIDGCRLGFGRSYKYRHNDMDDLEKKLRTVSDEKGKLIVVDGVFSMEGDLAPLPEIITLKRRYGARLMVDDAHGIGVFGERGRGTPEHFDVESEVDLVMGTFSKSFASLGGFIAGDENTIHYIKHHSRTLIFSASPPPAAVAAVRASLKILRSEPERRARLWEITKRMHKEFTGMGFDIGPTQTPIVPIYIGEDMKTFAFWKALTEAGLFTNPIIPPAVPPGKALIRTSYTATHTDEQIDQVLETFHQIGKQLGII